MARSKKTAAGTTDEAAIKNEPATDAPETDAPSTEGSPEIFGADLSVADLVTLLRAEDIGVIKAGKNKAAEKCAVTDADILDWRTDGELVHVALADGRKVEVVR